MKLSNFSSWAILSMVHFPPASLKVLSISSRKIGTYSGWVARLNIEFVINWVVVFTLRAPIRSCIRACNSGSFLSFGSFVSSRNHSTESSGFLKSPLFSRTTLSARIGAMMSRARRLQSQTAEFGDEKLSHRTQKWRKYSKLCRGYENVSCVL